MSYGPIQRVSISKGSKVLLLFSVMQNETFSNLVPALLLGKVTVLVTGGWRKAKKFGVKRKAP